jgi:hypothetical protein
MKTELEVQRMEDSGVHRHIVHFLSLIIIATKGFVAQDSMTRCYSTFYMVKMHKGGGVDRNEINIAPPAQVLHCPRVTRRNHFNDVTTFSFLIRRCNHACTEPSANNTYA